jgi:hypothetical protein
VATTATDPSAPASTDATAAEDGPSKFRAMLTSTLLIVFTMSVGLVCVLVLSCTLTQTRMSSISIDGVNISIWKLDDIRKQWSGIRAQIVDQSDALSKAESELSLEAKKDAENDIKYRPVRTALDGRLEEFNFRVRVFDGDLAKAMSEKSPAEQVGRLNAAQENLKAHPELMPLIEQITALYATYEPIYDERMKVKATLKAKNEQVAGLKASATSLRASLDDLFAQFSKKQIDDPTRARVENALFELYSEGFLGTFINKLIVTPPDILTLGLVILMGVLGSALQMTHALFKLNRLESVGAYLLRLSVGAITALVIFIVAKAGVPVIADASRLGGDAPINPYFVSFLAIISGLMSENAILSVQTQGARFFAPESAPEQLRWARSDLREAFKTANRNPDNVKHLLGVEDSQFDAWMSGKEPLPGNAQLMIAGVLETPRRDLFTDLPPEETKDIDRPQPNPVKG